MRNTFHTCLTRNLFICRMFISVSNLSCGNHYFISEKKKNDLKHVKKKNIYIHEKRKDNEKKKKYNMWKSRDRERLHIYIYFDCNDVEKKKKRYTFFTVNEREDRWSILFLRPRINDTDWELRKGHSHIPMLVIFLLDLSTVFLHYFFPLIFFWILWGLVL